MKALTKEQKLKNSRAKKAKTPKIKRIGKIKDANGAIPIFWNESQGYVILRQKDQFEDSINTLYIDSKNVKQIISILKTAEV